MRECFFNMLKKILFVFIVSIMFIPTIKALGTLQKKSYLEINPGQVAEFSILFWNQEPIEIELKEKVIPTDWTVIVEPKNFILDDKITSSEVMMTQDGYVKALPVKVLVISPEDVKPGNYEIVINMIAGKKDRDVTFFQEKNFNFRVNIPGEVIEQKENISEPIKNYPNKTGNFKFPSGEIDKLSSDPTRIIFWLIIVAFTLLMCWILYKS